jgi:hypothetical protein
LYNKINFYLKIIQNYTYTTVSNGSILTVHLPPFDTVVATVFLVGYRRRYVPVHL